MLLVVRAASLRLGGLVLLAVGLVPLILHEQPSIGDRLQAHVVLIPLRGDRGRRRARRRRCARAALAVARGRRMRRSPGLRLPLRDPPVPSDHLLPLYALLACGLAAHAYELVRGRARAPELGPLGPALAAWVLLASASLFWTSSLDKGAFAIVDVALPFGALAALVGSLGLARVFPLRLARVQVALGLLFALVAVYQWQTHHLFSSRKLEVDNAYASFYRVNSLFFDPSLFGRFQALAILTLVGALLIGRRVPRPALLVLATAAVFVGLALSYSQSSLLALDVGLVVIAGIVWRGSRRARVRRACRARPARRRWRCRRRATRSSTRRSRTSPRIAARSSRRASTRSNAIPSPARASAASPAPPARRPRSARASRPTTSCCRRRSSSGCSG